MGLNPFSIIPRRRHHRRNAYWKLKLGQATKVARKVGGIAREAGGIIGESVLDNVGLIAGVGAGTAIGAMNPAAGILAGPIIGDTLQRSVNAIRDYYQQEEWESEERGRLIHESPNTYREQRRFTDDDEAVAAGPTGSK